MQHDDRRYPFARRRFGRKLKISEPDDAFRGAVGHPDEVEIVEENNRMFYFAPGVHLQDIVSAVNEVGAAPGDLMAILEALREAGALRAELVVI